MRKRHCPFLHEASALARLEIPAVILGLPESDLNCRAVGSPSIVTSGTLAVMNEIIQPEQTIAEWILNLELRAAA